MYWIKYAIFAIELYKIQTILENGLFIMYCCVLYLFFFALLFLKDFFCVMTSNGKI